MLNMPVSIESALNQLENHEGHNALIYLWHKVSSFDNLVHICIFGILVGMLFPSWVQLHAVGRHKDWEQRRELSVIAFHKLPRSQQDERALSLDTGFRYPVCILHLADNGFFFLVIN